MWNYNRPDILYNCYMYYWHNFIFCDWYIGILHYKASRKRSIFDNISARINTIWQKCVAQMPLIIMELYKILWVRKGIVVVLFVIYIVSISGIKRGYIYDENMIIATNYYNEAEGMQLSEELYCIVNKYAEEKEYWDNRLIDISNSFDHGIRRVQ